MTTRLPILISGCAIVLALALMPFLRTTQSPAQAPLPSPMHGSFGSRFQPALEGIGSTKDLPAVVLDAAKRSDATHAPSGAAKDKRRGRAGRAR